MQKLSRYEHLGLYFLVFLGFVIYFNSLDVPFYFDDGSNIKHPSLRIEKITVSALKGALTEGTMKSRPISNLSFALNYYFNEFRVQGYHLVNVVIHIAAAVFLYFLIKLTFTTPAISNRYNYPKSIAYFSALLWLVHPLGTQSVTYIVQRMNSMAAMFYVLALFFYVKGRVLHKEDIGDGSRFYVFSMYFMCILTSLLALGSKEIAATLPLTIFLYEWYFFQDLSFIWIKRKVVWIVGSIGGAILFAWVYTGGHLLERTIHGFGGRDFTLEERLFTQMRVVVHYISLLFYPNPDRLVFDYDFPVSTSLVSPMTTLYSGLFLVLIFATGVFIARRERLISFCILWLFINLAVESTIVPLEMVYEHRTYLPAMLVVLFVVLVVYRIVNNIHFAGSILGGVCIFLMVWTIERNQVWQDPVKFWQSSLQKYPNNYRVHINVGQAYADTGKLDLAEQHFMRAIELNPKTPGVYNNLGVLLLKGGSKDDAEFSFLKSLEIERRYPAALMNIGKLYIEDKRFLEAEEIFSTLLKNQLSLDKLNEAKELLAITLIEIQKHEDALELIDEVLTDTNDDADLYLIKADTLNHLGKNQEAIRAYRQALAINHSLVSAHYNLARLLIEDRKVAESIPHYRKASKYVPEVIPVDYNFANVLLRAGQFEEARSHFNKYLDSMPNLADAYNNLGLAWVNTGDYQKAATYFNTAYVIRPDHPMAKRNLELVGELMDEQKKAVDTN